MVATTRDPSRADQSGKLRRLCSRYDAAICLSLAFKALNFILLVPLMALLLRLCLLRWGRVSIGNFEIVAFALSFEGMIAVASLGSILLGSLYLELAGLMRLLASERLPWWHCFTSSTRIFPRLVRLGFRQLVIYLAVAAPFLASVGLVYWLFWSDKDLNALLVLKPPTFWWGAGLAAVMVATYLAIAAGLTVRWLYAVPVLVFEPGPTPRAAMAISAKRSMGNRWRALKTIGRWFIAQSLLAFAIFGVIELSARLVLSQRFDSLGVAALTCAAFLVGHAVAASLLSVFANMTLARLIVGLYHEASDISVDNQEPPAGKNVTGWQLAGVLLILLLASCATAYVTLDHTSITAAPEITAHRAGALRGPENTVAALKIAIADGADWAEIDVQLTADQALAILHDSDLARIGGGHRQVSQSTLAEIQSLDASTLFQERFAGERVPTLRHVLVAARDRIQLNVELKPHGQADVEPLATRVVEEILQAGMVDQCRICSQSYESLQVVRRMEPRLPVGFIVATSLGDPTSLDVDFLMVKQNLATRELVDRARLRNISIHAWTVNDASTVLPLIAAGVDNIITDDVPMVRKKCDQILELGTVELLLLQARAATAR